MYLISLFLLAKATSSCINHATVPAPVEIWPEAESAQAELLRRGNRSYLTASGYEVVIVSGGAGQQGEVKKFPLNNRIKPEVKVHIEAPPTGRLYEYTVTNSTSSLDAIEYISLVVPHDLGPFRVLIQESASRSAWRPGVSVPIAMQAELHTESRGQYADWSMSVSPENKGLAPGQTASGFVIETQLKPGFTTFYAEGALPNIPDDYADLPGVDAVFISQLRWSDAHVLTIGPQFNAASTFAEVVENFKDGVNRLWDCQGPTDFLSAFRKILDRSDSWASLRRELKNLPPAKSGGLEDDIANAIRITAGESK